MQVVPESLRNALGCVTILQWASPAPAPAPATHTQSGISIRPTDYLYPCAPLSGYAFLKCNLVCTQPHNGCPRPGLCSGWLYVSPWEIA